MSKQAVFTLKKSKRQNFETLNSLRLVIDWTNLRKPILLRQSTLSALWSLSPQETQLSLKNRATRLEVSQGYQTWYHFMLGMVSC